MSAPLRWLLLATHVPADGRSGGIVRYTVELARALDQRSDVELHVLCTAETAPFFAGFLPRPHVHVAPRLPRLAMAVFERFGLVASPWRTRFDVVQGTKHLLPLGVRGTRVLTAHDMLLLDRPDDFDPLKRRLLRRPYLASLRSADVVVGVSAATAARVGRWVPAARVRVVGLATSSALRQAALEPVPELVGRPFALVVGDPSPRKNLPVLVDNWSAVVDRVPGAVLAVVGPDSWGDTVHGARFETLRSAGHLVRLAGVGDGVLRWCYENATVVLAPSVAEGFGLPALEALDFGAPLVTSEDPALVEVSGALARHVPAARGDLWVDAAADALARVRVHSVAPPARTWDQVADDTVAAVRAAGVSRGPVSAPAAR